MGESWVDGTYESGSDPPEPPASPAGEQPLNTETGVGVGLGEPSTFEPEEDEAAGEA